MADYKQYPEVGKTYYHYKGGKYEVLTLATHSESEEVLVIYKSLHFGSIHARPLPMWFEVVTDKEERRVTRFTLWDGNFK